MPFKTDQETLEKLFARALESKEIRDGIDSSGLGDDFFRRQLSTRADKIWSLAAEELTVLSRIEESLKAAQSGYRQAAPRPPSLLSGLEEAGPIMFGLLMFAGMIAVIVSLFAGFKNVFGRLNQQPWSWISLSLLSLIAVGVGIYVSLLLSFRKRRRLFSENPENSRTIKQLQEEQTKLQAAMEEALLEKGIKSELRAIINAEMQPSYGLNLSVRTAPGLAEVFDPAYEIPTESKDRLKAMLEDMPGGSIGIAGPRGSGKSTLIWSLCRGAVTTLKDRPLFALMTSAPVKYDGRDFILHLFSSLCHKVLGRNAVEAMGDEETPFDFAHSLPWWLSYRFVGQAFATLITLGTVVFSFGIFLTSELSKAPPPDSSKAALANQSQDKSVSLGPSPAVSLVSQLPGFLRATGLQPGSFLISGFVFLVAGNLLLFWQMSGNRRRRERSRLERAKRQVEEELELRIGSDLARSAVRMLRQIRFQQSYSSGWSGALKLPIGLEGSINSALSLAERQRSFPEIVDAYRDFVKLVAAKNSILIGVDELDKLESDEIAQQFLNEIKSIFNLDHCYYLISVSENAISNFERRGLPFRDAFDSAFDTIIYVDYLNLESAKRLLRRRVIGLEVPFLCLCHCLSGGLARDLIRSCREMLELVRNEKAETNLGAVCEKLVIADIKSKLHAMEVSVRKARLEPELSNMIDTIRKIESSTETKEKFLEARRKIVPPAFQIDTHEGVPTDITEKRRQINDLALELHTYLYFAATLLEFFCSTLTEKRLVSAEKDGEITKLARAKQSFSVNAYTALVLLDEFRKSNNLAVA